MKSEERQKLAKERREEKAKYLGKWTSPLHWKRAPPSVGVNELSVVLLLGWLLAADGMNMN